MPNRPLRPEDGGHLYAVGSQPRAVIEDDGFAGKGGFDRTTENESQSREEEVFTREIVFG